MDKKEFYEQMIIFGRQLLEEETNKKVNLKARENLQKLYNALAEAVEASVELELSLDKKDKRALTVNEVSRLIMEAQNLVNPFAEDEDLS